MCVGLSAKVVRISDGTAVVDAGGVCAVCGGIDYCGRGC